MRKIKIICYIDNNLLYNYKIFIIKNNNVIYQEKISNLVYNTITIPKDDVYSLVITNLLNTLLFSTSFISNKLKNNTLSINVNTNKQKFIYLTDYYYPNLPIKKGKIILWQKNKL